MRKSIIQVQAAEPTRRLKANISNVGSNARQTSSPVPVITGEPLNNQSNGLPVRTFRPIRIKTESRFGMFSYLYHARVLKDKPCRLDALILLARWGHCKVRWSQLGRIIAENQKQEGKTRKGEL